MARAQLYQWFKDNGISLREIAAATGYHYTYVSELLTGATPLTDGARMRFVETFPETAIFLLDASVLSATGKAIAEGRVAYEVGQ